ncbi:VOC family protein [Nocardioides insulae]|uniref:VOC family protein n=1 Tax=Nocardioides insulae TaxID=394734 RepID=UPI000402BC95|nr:VOC family protein [Nocardioides insulae]
MTTVRTYPEGVPSWVDLEPADLPAALDFYGRLFGWTFQEMGPPGQPPSYVVAQLDGRDVAGFSPGSGEAAPVWNTYVAVDDAERAAGRVTEAGGRVVLKPAAAGEGGRLVVCEDPDGVRFRLWEANRRPGVQATNEPGSWNFSDLHAEDPERAIAFYLDLFGWVVSDVGFAAMIQLPGYGNHLAATIDPGIHQRQSDMEAPPGFADAVAWLAGVGPDERPHWHVTFAVADRDESAAAVERLGGTVLGGTDTEWARTALVRDPQGAVFTASQFLG